MEELWPIVTVVGPILLAAVILWAWLRSRKVTPREDAANEKATHDLYAKEDRRSDD